MSGKYATVTSTIKTIMTEQGTPRLWKGTLPACMRQCVFAGLKLAMYEPFRNKLCKTEEHRLARKLFIVIIMNLI